MNALCRATTHVMVDGARTAVVIDDDPAVRLMLRVALEAIGFVVHEADTGQDGVDLVRRTEPDLVTLDLVLPGFGGVEVCRRIRQVTGAYIVMITASSDEVDRLIGLTTGADDYVTKPFSPREVQARVSAMFRRPRMATSMDAPDPFGLIAPPLPAPPKSFGPLPASAPFVRLPSRLPPDPRRPDLAGTAGSDASAASAGHQGGGSQVEGLPFVGVGPTRRDASTLYGAGPLSGADPRLGGGHPDGLVDHAAHDAGVLWHGRIAVDVEARVATCGAVELPLTKIEFDLLATMMGNPRRVWRRETLLNIVWGGQWSDYHVVEVHIGNLRRKLGDAIGGGALLIKTVRGVGYRMSPAEPPPDSGNGTA